MGNYPCQPIVVVGKARDHVDDQWRKSPMIAFT